MVRQILQSGLSNKEHNLEAEKSILITSYFLNDETLVKDINRFPMATILTRDFKRNATWSNLDKYWNFPLLSGNIAFIDNNLVEEGRHKLSKAIYDLANMAPNYTSLLSGGLDSRTIVSFLSQRGSVKVLNYGSDYESSIAKKICKEIKADLISYPNSFYQTECFVSEFKKIYSLKKVTV